MKRLICFCLIIWNIQIADAQSYKGFWQGYITSEAEGYYISGYSLNVLQQEGNIISGKGYFYHNTIFFAWGKFDFIGQVKGTSCKITELRLQDSLVLSDSSLCIKIMDLEFATKNSYDYLTGRWRGSIYTKTQCDPGKVFLRRYDPKLPEGIEPIPDHILTDMKKDKPGMSFMKTQLAKPIIIPVKKTMVTLAVADYLRSDYDTVSIYYNRHPVVERLHLRKKPAKFTIRLDRSAGLNEIVMYANNLGQVPPNTSTLTIDDGVKKETVIISSTLQTSAVLYLQYEPDK
ncbi:MAG: hypothetical protein K0S09_2125 [Sphingobacteriaceae bacterium]|nr:hypothetical protein [Sphingobacteriaceae bacterium]